MPSTDRHRGVNGLRLKDKWRRAEDLIVMVEDFNMMMLMGPHTALGNLPRSIEYNVEWVTECSTRGIY